MARASWKNRRVLVTAGPTREHLDDIRFLSNASTGRMGIEIAHVLRDRRAQVVLVLGPSEVRVPAGIEVVPVVSTADLLAACKARLPGCDAAFFAAAPSDFRPKRRRKGKPPREGAELQLELVSTPDVAATVGRAKGARLHVGFALEVRGGVARARRKLVRKHLDAIVLNSKANFGAGGGEAHYVLPEGKPIPLPTTSKRVLARAIVGHAQDALPRA